MKYLGEVKKENEPIFIGHAWDLGLGMVIVCCNWQTWPEFGGESIIQFDENFQQIEDMLEEWVFTGAIADFPCEPKKSETTGGAAPPKRRVAHA